MNYSVYCINQQFYKCRLTVSKSNENENSVHFYEELDTVSEKCSKTTDNNKSRFLNDEVVFDAADNCIEPPHHLQNEAVFNAVSTCAETRYECVPDNATGSRGHAKSSYTYQITTTPIPSCDTNWKFQCNYEGMGIEGK